MIWINLKVDMKNLTIIEKYQELLETGTDDIVLRMVSLNLLLDGIS